MNQNYHNNIIATLYSLSRMIQAEQTYPHTDCPDTHPTHNICPPCPKHAFCSARWEFIVNMALLEKSGED